MKITINTQNTRNKRKIYNNNFLNGITQNNDTRENCNFYFLRIENNYYTIDNDYFESIDENFYKKQIIFKSDTSEKFISSSGENF